LGDFSGFFDQFLAGFGVTILDITGNRPAKQHAFLRHVADLIGQIFQFELANIHAVQQDLPGRHIVKARNQIDQR